MAVAPQKEKYVINLHLLLLLISVPEDKRVYLSSYVHVRICRFFQEENL